jgi:hypothetical protein
MTPEQYAQIRALNQSMLDAKEAVTLALSGITLSEAPSEKAQKLAALIKASTCTRTHEPDLEDFTRTWKGQTTLEGGACAVNLSHKAGYDSAARSWSIDESFSVVSADFQKESQLRSYSNEGVLVYKNLGTAGSQVEGRISYLNFKGQDLGLVYANANLRQNYTSTGRGSGRIILTLEARLKWRHTITLLWRLPDLKITYQIDGRDIDAKTYNELFSGFKLTEIIDRSMKMR